MAEAQRAMSVPWAGARCWPWECTWCRGWVCAWCVSSRAAGAGYRALGTEGSVCGPGYPDIWCRVEPERVERGRGREKEREVY